MIAPVLRQDHQKSAPETAFPRHSPGCWHYVNQERAANGPFTARALRREARRAGHFAVTRLAPGFNLSDRSWREPGSCGLQARPPPCAVSLAAARTSTPRTFSARSFPRVGGERFRHRQTLAVAGGATVNYLIIRASAGDSFIYTNFGRLDLFNP